MFQPNRILIVKPSSFGDIVHGLPVLAALKRHWPDAGIDWAVKREWFELLAEHPLLRRVIFFPRTTLEGFYSWADLRAESYDMVIDLQGLLRSGLYAAMTGCSMRVGFFDSREGSSCFYTHKIKTSKCSVHAVDRGLDLVRQLGVRVESGAKFPISEGSREQDWIEDLGREHGIVEGEPLCVIHPASRGPIKRWPPDRFARTADELVERHRFRVVLIGGESQKDQIENVAQQMKGRAINLAGKTSLRQLAALLRRSDVLVTNDSGPMHLAAAVRTRVVAIFGPTDPARVGPYGEGHLVLRKNIDCSACSRRACVRNSACMKAVEVEEVIESARAIVNRATPRDVGAEIGT